jgi:hypothetical protein
MSNVLPAVPKPAAVGIGSRVWLWNENRRVYGPDRGSPIWREKWEPHTVVAETSRSWVTNHGAKIAKNRPADRWLAWSEEDIERRAYIANHRHKIADRIGGIGACDLTVEQLSEIARIVGYPVTYPPTSTNAG